MPTLTEADSKRITALRFLLIMFVVFIHNNLTADNAINYYHLAFSEPAVITHFKFLVTNVLGSAAVPLFFLFSGYLQFCKADSYPILLKKRAKMKTTLSATGIFWIGSICFGLMTVLDIR